MIFPMIKSTRFLECIQLIEETDIISFNPRNCISGNRQHSVSVNMEYYEISNYSKQTILQRGKFATLINLN